MPGGFDGSTSPGGRVASSGTWWEKQPWDIFGRASKTHLVFIILFFLVDFEMVFHAMLWGFSFSLLLRVLEAKNWCVYMQRGGREHGLSPGERELQLHVSIKVAGMIWRYAHLGSLHIATQTPNTYWYPPVGIENHKNIIRSHASKSAFLVL